MTAWFTIPGPIYYTAKMITWAIGGLAVGLVVKKLWRRFR